MQKENNSNRIFGKPCLECGGFINPKLHKYVELSTFNCQNIPDEHAFFHFNCWTYYFNKRVENRMKLNMQFMQDRVMSLMDTPLIKQVLSQVQGSDIALNMLKLPLKTDNLKNKIISKLKKHGKRAKSRRKKRN